MDGGNRDGREQGRKTVGEAEIESPECSFDGGVNGQSEQQGEDRASGCGCSRFGRRPEGDDGDQPEPCDDAGGLDGESRVGIG